jgi:4'-phosphopantetheinyl transferase EntD
MLLTKLLPESVAVSEAIGAADAEPLWGEEEEAVRSAVEKRRREFTLGRTCARRALSILGHPPVAIPVADHRQPAWPAGIVGSITHCPAYCAAAIARAAEVAAIGIDAEVDAPLPPGVSDVVLTDGERSRVAALGGGANWDRVLFSAKESVFKAWFPVSGRWLDFGDAEVVFDARLSSFSARVAIPDRSIGPLFHGRYAVASGVVLTAVVVPRTASTGSPARPSSVR